MSKVDLRQRYRVVPLVPGHDREAFSCGVLPLDRYLKVQASQDARRNVATIFVAEDVESGAIHGFYSLSMASVLLDQLPATLAKKMPRYPAIPAVRLGRLAVDRDAKGIGLGVHLLVDAMTRALATEIAWATLLVDAKDETARSFYEKYGFCSFADDPNHLHLTRATIESIVA